MSDSTNEIIENISTLVIVINAHITDSNLEVLNSCQVRIATTLKNIPNSTEEI